MINDAAGGGVGSGGFDQQLGDKPLTVSSVLKEFQGLKDKFKNEDEDDCECFLVGGASVPWFCVSCCGRFMQKSKVRVFCARLFKCIHTTYFVVVVFVFARNL